VRLKTLLAAFLVLSALTVATLSVALIQIARLREEDIRQFIDSAESVRIAEDLNASLLEHVRESLLYLVEDTPLRAQRRSEIRQRVTDRLQEIRQYSVGVQEENAILRVEKSFREYLIMRNRMDASRVDPIVQYQEIVASMDSTLATINQLIDINLKQAGALQASAAERNIWARRLIFSLIICSIALALGLAYAIMNHIYRPLVRLRDAIRRFSVGREVAAPEEGVFETREIAKCLNEMGERLEQQRQERLRFIASIAHDLRNPLNSMAMASELMLSQSAGEEQRKLPALIQRQVRSLDRLVSDLLDTSRIESGQFEIEKKPVTLGILVRSAVELYDHAHDIHRFELDVRDPGLKCLGDANRLSQVFNNLLSNAVKYSPNGGLVEIRVLREGDHAIVAVRDQGIGVAPDDIDLIFRPFNRSKMTKETIPGIGLGLSASRRIVEAHGGTLTVESQLGRGAEFRVRLPALPVADRRAENLPELGL
jgi:two-component system, OmpR family, sensor histidine kinase MtrB